MNKPLILGAVTGLILIVAAIIYLPSSRNGAPPATTVSSFDECVSAGYLVLETFPPQCKAPDGRIFVQNLSTTTGTTSTGTIDGGAEESPVQLASPQPHDAVSSPLTITGKARGTWFFEAVFPIRLIDNQGNVLAQGHATAQGEWMTTDYVPFRAMLTFDYPGTSVTSGFIVFEKDNPSGLPEYDAEIKIPVKFVRTASNGNGTQLTACRPSGCSGQICSDKDVTSTCEWTGAYACYKQPFAKCERQANGTCGWTHNSELAACLANPPRQ